MWCRRNLVELFPTQPYLSGPQQGNRSRQERGGRNWAGSLFKAEVRRTDNNLTCVTSLLRKPEATWEPSAPPGTAALPTFVGLGLSGGEKQYGGGERFREGQTSGPLGACHSSIHSAFLLKHIHCVRYKTRRSRDTEHSSPAGRGGAGRSRARRKKGMLVYTTPSPPQRA